MAAQSIDPVLKDYIYQSRSLAYFRGLKVFSLVSLPAWFFGYFLFSPTISGAWVWSGLIASLGLFLSTKRPKSPFLSLLLLGVLGLLFSFAMALGIPDLSLLGERVAIVLFLAYMTTGIFSTYLFPPSAAVWVLSLSTVFIGTYYEYGIARALLQLEVYLVYVVYLSIFLVNYYRTITKRYSIQFEAEVKRAELNAIFSQSPLILLFIDSNDRVQRASDGIEQVTGTPKSKIIGTNFVDSFGSFLPRDSLLEMNESILKREGWSSEVSCLDPQGASRDYKVTVKIIEGPGRSFLGTLVLVQDITEEKLAQQTIQQQKDLLALLFRDFEDQAKDWMWETDEDLRITYISEKYQKSLKNPVDLGVDFPTFLEDRRPANGTNSTESIVGLFSALRGRKAFRETELLVSGWDHDCWISLTGAPLYGGEGEFLGWRGVGRDITEKKELESALVYRANYDARTGLPNRKFFKDSIKQSIDQADLDFHGVLGLIHLSKLETIRSTFGSSTITRIVQFAISHFRETFGSEVLIARLDRDELAFWIDLRDVHRLAAIHSYARLMNGKELIHAADLALNSARDLESRRVVRYQEHLSTELFSRLSLVQDFLGSLEQGHFFLVYQPQVSATTKEIVGAEALVRWNHPTRGLISPGEFISLAENNGFMDELGEFVLNQACKDAATWSIPVTVSVNISGAQLRKPRRLSRAVFGALESSGLALNRLVLEITESAVFGSENEVYTLLQQFKEAGISVALDDFGTGYSSLAYLHRLKVGELKIDQSFVRSLGQDSDSSKVISTILELASAFSMETVGEGVETAEQAAFLTQSGCTRLQGYLYGRPEPLDRFLVTLNEGGQGAPRADGGNPTGVPPPLQPPKSLETLELI